MRNSIQEKCPREITPNAQQRELKKTKKKPFFIAVLMHGFGVQENTESYEKFLGVWAWGFECLRFVLAGDTRAIFCFVLTHAIPRNIDVLCEWRRLLWNTEFPELSAWQLQRGFAGNPKSRGWGLRRVRRSSIGLLLVLPYVTWHSTPTEASFQGQPRVPRWQFQVPGRFSLKVRLLLKQPTHVEVFLHSSVCVIILAYELLFSLQILIKCV